MNNAAAAAAFSPISLLSSVASIGVLVCFILVLVKMFQNKDTAGAIISIVTLLICCIGLLFNINFILGWTKASRWNMKKLMYTYTAFFAVYWITTLITIPQSIALFQQQFQAIQQQQQQQIQQEQQRRDQIEQGIPKPADDSEPTPTPDQPQPEPAPAAAPAPVPDSN